MSDNSVTEQVMVELRGVTKSYTRGRQQVEVLRGIDLTIAAGDFVEQIARRMLGGRRLLERARRHKTLTKHG